MNSNPPSFEKKLMTALRSLYVKDLAIVNPQKNMESFGINYRSLQICLSHSTRILEKKFGDFLLESRKRHLPQDHLQRCKWQVNT